MLHFGVECSGSGTTSIHVSKTMSARDCRSSSFVVKYIIMSKLPKSSKKAIIYQDEQLYVCLASRPMTKGHIVIVWKKEVNDIKDLSDRSYHYLMDTVSAVRNSLLKTLDIKKVYLIYMDEIKHVHWHLIPRYRKKGFELLQNKPRELKNFSLVNKIKKNLIFD